MPTLSERLEAATRQHAASIAAILASASIEEVAALARGLPASDPPPPVEPETPCPTPATEPSDLSDEEQIHRAVLEALRLIEDCRGSVNVDSVLDSCCPYGFSRSFIGERIAHQKWEGQKVARLVRDGDNVSFEITNSGRNMIAAHEDQHEPPKATQAADPDGLDALLQGKVVAAIVLVGGKISSLRLRQEIDGFTDRRSLRQWMSDLKKAIFPLVTSSNYSEGKLYKLSECGKVLAAEMAAELWFIEKAAEPGRARSEFKTPPEHLGEIVEAGLATKSSLKKGGQPYFAITDRGREFLRQMGKDTKPLGERPAHVPSGSVIDRALAWLKENPWSTVGQIAAGSGLSAAQVNESIYRGKFMEHVERHPKAGEAGTYKSVFYALKGTPPKVGFGAKVWHPAALGKVVDWLRDNPDSTLREIAAGCKLSDGYVSVMSRGREEDADKWEDYIEESGNIWVTARKGARTFRVKEGV